MPELEPEPVLVSWMYCMQTQPVAMRPQDTPLTLVSSYTVTEVPGVRRPTMALLVPAAARTFSWVELMTLPV